MRHFCFEMKCFRLNELTQYDLINDGGKTIFMFELIKSAFFRILIISIGFYALSFCIKNYNAVMHNRTINAHKANSLAAVVHLMENIKSDQGKENIMNQAAHSIFSHQKTGYFSKDKEPKNPLISEKVIERLIP